MNYGCRYHITATATATTRIMMMQRGLHALVRSEEGARCWQGGDDDAANALIQATEHGWFKGIVAAIAVELCVVWALYASLDSIQRVHDKIDGEGGLLVHQPAHRSSREHNSYLNFVLSASLLRNRSHG